MNTTTQIDDSIWESIAGIISRVQQNALTANSVSQLLEVIGEGKLPVKKDEFSIVYQDYGTTSPIFLIASGKIANKKSTQFSEPFPIGGTPIIDIIHKAQDKILYLKTNKECIEHGFPDRYKSIIITPLRLNKKKIIGAFLAHSHFKENAYHQLLTLFNLLSNAITFYLRSNIITRRTKVFKDFHNDLVKQSYKKETDIISYLVEKLKAWFTHDDISIILINPFNTDEYLLVCEKGVINENFRKSQSLAENDLSSLIGSILPDVSKESIILNSVKDIKDYGITSGCKSWLGTRMHTASDNNIGFIILQNFIAEHSYEIGEEKLVDDFSDFMAIMLTEYRKDQREQSLSRFKNMLLLDKPPSDAELYNQAQITLNELYGEVPLAIIRTNRITRQLELAQSTIKNFSLDKNLEEKIEDYIENPRVEHPMLEGLFSSSMKSGGNKLGCFLIPSTKCGPLTAKYIDDLSDLLAVIIDKQEKENIRLAILAEFGSKVPSMTVTKEGIVERTREYVSKAMFSENLYIALYDKGKNEISFPFIIKDGQPWNIANRQLNQEKKGKTEEIILTGKPILHKTKAESRTWYDQPNHEEFAGNTLASWIGVPILSPDGVIGVIAAYHSDEEFVYSEEDLFFLQMLSHPVSGLFRALALEDAKLELEETNRKLKETQNLIVERESQLANAAFMQDLAHRINNAVGSVYADIDDGLNYIKEVSNGNNSVNSLGFSIESLEQALKTLDKVIEDTKYDKKPTAESINLFLMIKLISAQVALEKKLNQAIFDIRVSKDAAIIMSFQQNLYQLLFILIENAGDAIREKGDFPEAFIKITSDKIGDDIFINITDNGVEIPENIKLFELGNTSKKRGNGYGLWRAKIIANSLSGSIVLTENTQSQKTFTISIKSHKKLKEKSALAFVIDDEESWRNIISRWLKDEGYQVYDAMSKETAIELIDSTKESPAVIFLDISLDSKNAFNSDGLQLIDIFKARFPEAKVVIVSAYSEKANLYKNDVELIIDKVGAGIALRRSIFLEKTKTILNNTGL